MIHCLHDDYTETLINSEQIVRICNGCGQEMVYRVTDRKEEVEKRWEG